MAITATTIHIRPISRADFIPAMSYISKQCIVFIVFSMLIIIADGVGVSSYGGYVYGVAIYYHCFWVSGLVSVCMKCYTT